MFFIGQVRDRGCVMEVWRVLLFVTTLFLDVTSSAFLHLSSICLQLRVVVNMIEH